MNCVKCDEVLVVKPVPGAIQFPRRLECPVHGYYQEPFSSSSPNGLDGWREEMAELTDYASEAYYVSSDCGD